MKVKITELANKIKEAQTAYYNGSSIIDDDEYDALLYELSLLDSKHPLIFTIGAEVISNEWKKERHLFSLGSLNKVNTTIEMEKWITTTLLDKPVVVVEKLDGLSIGCQYEDGILIKAILRGNGYEAENIYSNVIKMKGVVKSIPKFTGVIRGEIVLTKSDHQKHFPSYANPRNAASGLCRRFDGEGVEHLTLMVYDILGAEFKTVSEQFEFLKQHKFIIPNYKLCKTPKEVNELWKQYQDSIRDSLDVEIDGLVISVDDIEFQQLLGESSLRPKGKMAFKFANQFVKTTVKDITFATGGTGRITPICWFEPVNLLGSNIEKASLYNAAYIKKLGIGIGAEVLVCKAGEIIPRVEKVIKPADILIDFPEFCPTCDEDIIEEGEYHICINSECPAQVEGRLLTWISTLNILEFGEGIIQKVVAAGLANTVSDLYKLTIEQLASLEHMGEKSATKVYNNLHEKKPLPLEIFLGGLSIGGVAVSSIKMIMEAGYNSLDKILNLSLERLQMIKGLGPVKAQTIYKFLQENKEMVKELNEVVGVKEVVEGKLSGKSVVFTGTMSTKRSILEEMVVNAGGTTKGSVGRSTTYLVIADVNSLSTKAIAARKLGVKLISEKDFLEMIK